MATGMRSVDMLLLDELFEFSGGYVMDFTNATFARFFAELGVDINNPQYAEMGTSKGKRLRCFFHAAEAPAVARALRSLWEYRQALRQRSGLRDSSAGADERLIALIARLEGKPASAEPRASLAPETAAVDATKAAELRNALMGLAGLSPQPRGFGFETFLNRFFNAFGMEAREPFRLRGEQIDGSFALDGDTYLLEAKWQAPKMGVAELHAFHGKLNEKAAWTRGLFVSDSGFTEDGLAAFGRGKRLICMDGLDLADALGRALPLNEVLRRKARRAAETGHPFARVRDLFPS